MNNADMSQYLDVFLDEGREQLALLETNILEMERGNHTPEMLQVLFRAAHTLKGSGRAMGFLVLGDLTHEMENILDYLRQGTIQVTTPIINALLGCLDALGQLIDTVAEHGVDTGPVARDIPALVVSLHALSSSAAAPPPLTSASVARDFYGAFPLAPHVLAAATDAVASGALVYELSVVLSPDCVMKSVRVWMIMGALEPLGTLLSSDPSEELLEADSFEFAFRLLFATELGKDDIGKAIGKVSEISSWDLTLWQQSVEQTVTSQIAVAALAEPEIEAEIEQSLPTALPNKPAAHQSLTIRVEVSRLDKLLNLVGELVIERSQVHQICADLHSRYPQDGDAKELLETTHRIARVTAELQDQIMKTRLLPIDGVFLRMPRMVRDLAERTGKLVRFEMHGGETELDRTVLESLADPLIHILRNSIDHGIELPVERAASGKPSEGLVTLSARHEENRIVIEIVDDGAGIDPDKLKEHAVRIGMLKQAAASLMSDQDAVHLIFASGFSTAATLSDISGRGVGMDIVKSNLEKIGGIIAVETVCGEGSVFRITLPMTLAIVRAVLVRSSDSTYVLPLTNIVEMLRLGISYEGRELHRVGGRPVISLRGRTIPLVNLTDVLGGESTGETRNIREDAFVVVVGIGNRQIGLCVDDLIGEQEVVVKSMGMLLGDIPGLSGATILGNGQVALIVDVSKATDHFRPIESGRGELVAAA